MTHRLLLLSYVFSSIIRNLQNRLKKNARWGLVQAHYYEETANHYDDHSSAEWIIVEFGLQMVDALGNAIGARTTLDVETGTGKALRFLLDSGKDTKGIEPVKALIEQGEAEGIPLWSHRNGRRGQVAVRR
jgi:hypothetical protein